MGSLKIQIGSHRCLRSSVKESFILGLCSKVLTQRRNTDSGPFNSFMGTQNSSKETRARAKQLAHDIGSYHVDLNMDKIVSGFTMLFSKLTYSDLDANSFVSVVLLT